jgi:hypothetical protein
MLKLFLFLSLSCARPHYVSEAERDIKDVSGGCGYLFSSEKICLKIQWIKKPSESSFGEMDLIFVDTLDQSRFIDPMNEPNILLWMPGMGHGSSPVSVKRVDVGHYRAREIFFIMTGEWEIHYQLKSGSDVVEEKIQKVII